MEVYINMHLKNATVKTSFEKLSRTLIQPFGITIETDIQLYSDIDEDVTTPRSVVTLTTGLLSVLIGQEHIMCFDKILKELAALVPVSIFFFFRKTSIPKREVFWFISVLLSHEIQVKCFSGTVNQGFLNFCVSCEHAVMCN